MTSRQANVLLDHQQAELIGLDSEVPQRVHLQARRHDTRQHHGGVRDGHEFFGALCGAIDAFDEVLLGRGPRAHAAMRRPPSNATWQLAQRSACGCTIRRASGIASPQSRQSP